MNERSQAETGQEDLPPSLERALREPDDYAVRLRTGEVVRFTHAERHGCFVTLFAPDGAEFPHGLEVRIGEITWCASRPRSVTLADSPGIDGPEYPNAAPSGPGVRVPLRIEQAE